MRADVQYGDIRMSDSTSASIAHKIYHAYKRGDTVSADALWMQTPSYLAPDVRHHVHASIVEFDNVDVFEHCIGWGAMAGWLRDFQATTPLDAVASCPHILAAWWKKGGSVTWRQWSQQTLGSLLWMDVCSYMAAGNWHVWGSQEDHIAAHLSHFYEAHPNSLSKPQQEALMNQLDAFALTNERLMAWLRAQSFYSSAWEDALFMQTHNHHRHVSAFDARLHNPHSRAVAYYIHQLRSRQAAPFMDGYWFNPSSQDADCVFAQVLVHTSPDIAFHSTTSVDLDEPEYAPLIESLVLHQRIDPDLSMLMQWLRTTPVQEWGKEQESAVGPW